MSELNLTVACGYYDRTVALQDGSVKVPGIDINYVPMRPGDLFRRQARHAEFDVAELSFSTYCMLNDRGDERMIAIPVFPSRKFRHGHIFVNDDAVQEPADLIGKKIGAHEYQNSASVWIRGMLDEEYGVSPTAVKWHLGGINAPKPQGDRIPLEFQQDMDVTRIPEDRFLSQMLVDKEISAIISAERPNSFVEPNSPVRRLFPDYPTVEREYFERTRIFPIMHLVVIKREIYERHPWVARALYDGFEKAKAVGQERLRYTGALFASVPWLGHHIEEADALSGGADMFQYGLASNRATIEKFVGYQHKQGLLSAVPEVADLFAVETRDT